MQRALMRAYYIALDKTPAEVPAMYESENLLRLPDVLKRTGLSRASVYTRMKEGGFPKPVHIGPRAIAWPQSDIDEWVANIIRTNRRDA